VNVASANAYNLSIRINGTQVATLALAAAATGAQTTALAVAVVAGDRLTAWIDRTAGAGASEFNDITAVVEITT
jgi:hypothetical protein